MLSVTDQSGEARYPSFKGIMAAKKKPLETWSLSDLGVDAGEVGLSVAWTAGRGHQRAPAAHRRRDRHRRGRLGRHGAGRVPRVQEVHLSRTDRSTSHDLKFWSSSTTSTARSASRPTSCSPSPSASASRPRSSSARADKADDVAEAVKKYGAEKVYVVDDAEIKGYLVAPKAEALPAARREGRRRPRS